MKEPNRKFKGVWIPKNLWLHPKLTWLEKCVVAEIDSLSDEKEGCVASNAYLASMFRVSVGRMKNIITQLRKKKIIMAARVEGRKEALRLSAGVTESVTVGCNGIRDGGVTDSVTVNGPLIYTEILSKERVGSAGSSPMKEPETSGPGTPNPSSAPPFPHLEAAFLLGTKVFNRPTSQLPSDAELRLLRSLIPRDGFQAELEAILAFAGRLLPRDRMYELPKTLPKLLERWTETLDKARNYNPNAHRKVNQRNLGCAPSITDYGAVAKRKMEHQALEAQNLRASKAP